MADEAPGYGDIPISPRSEGAEVIPIQPSFHEREGNRADAPQVDLPAAIAAHEQRISDRREAREVLLPGVFDRDNRQATITTWYPWTDDEARAATDRFNRIRANITQIGNRVLADKNAQLASRTSALTTQLEALDHNLAELLPDSKSDLGDIGEFSAEEYGARLTRALETRQALTAQLEQLETQIEDHNRRRSDGGYINGLNTICTSPELERRYVEMLHGAAIEELDLPKPTFRSIDLDKPNSLRSRSQSRLNRAEDTYARLEARDARRARLGDRAMEELARTKYPALRSRLRSTS